MVKELMHDPLFLGRTSAPATKEDLQTAQDLLDTLLAHKDTCVGMAANMIGICKRIIAFDNGGTYMLKPFFPVKNGKWTKPAVSVSADRNMKWNWDFP